MRCFQKRTAAFKYRLYSREHFKGGYFKDLFRTRKITPFTQFTKDVSWLAGAIRGVAGITGNVGARTLWKTGEKFVNKHIRVKK